MARPKLKICGLRQPRQALAIAAMGVEAIGVIGVAASPRFLEPQQRRLLFGSLAEACPACRRVLVVADPDDGRLPELEPQQGHDVLQLHGDESPERCAELRQRLGLEVWKALRIRSAADLDRAAAYATVVDALLLDAWTAEQLGGTGRRLPLDWLEGFSPPLPWWLAGGISAAAVGEIRMRLHPWGLDVSSSVERAPGDKNLEQVRALLQALRE